MKTSVTERVWRSVRMYYKLCIVIHAMAGKKLYYYYIFFKATLGFRNPFIIHSTAQAKVLRKIACSNPSHSCLSYGMTKVTRLFQERSKIKKENTEVRRINPPLSSSPPIRKYIHQKWHTVNLPYFLILNTSLVTSKILLTFGIPNY